MAGGGVVGGHGGGAAQWSFGCRVAARGRGGGDIGRFLCFAAGEGFQLGLLPPEAGVGARGFDKGIMRARLDHAAVLEHVDAIGAAQGCESVRDHDDGLRARQLVHKLDDGALALGIDVRGGLVQQVHRSVVQQRSGHGQTLALAARQVAAGLGHGGIQAPGLAREAIKAAAGQHTPQFVVGRRGFRQREVRAQRSLEQVALERHGRDRLAQRGARDVAQVDPAHFNRATIGGIRPGQNAGERGLARSALPRHTDEAAGRSLEVDVLEHRPLAVERVAHAAARNISARRVHRARAVAVLRRVQNGEHLLGGGHAVHGRMEKRSQRAQRQKELGRQEHDGERGAECHGTFRILPEHHGNAHRGTAEREQVHDGDGVELHAQKAHGLAAESLGPAVHLLVRLLVGAVYLERGQSLDILEEHAAEVGVGTPVVAHGALGEFLHRHDGCGDERHAHDERRCRRQRDRRQAGEQRERGQHRVEQLRQVRAEVAFQLLGALHADLNGLARGDTLAIRRPQAHELVVHLLAHGALGNLACSQSHTLRERLARHAHDHGQRGENSEVRRRLHGDRIGEQRLQKRADHEEQGDIGKKGDPLEHDIGSDKLPRRRNEGEQAFVEHGG